MAKTEMSLEKIPRWALVFGTIGCFSLLGIFVRQSLADMETVKTVAYQARSTADQDKEATARLESEMTELKTGLETWRKEYREDQKSTQDKLDAITSAIYKHNN